MESSAKCHKGFNLIELSVVFAVAGVMTAAVVSSNFGMEEKKRQVTIRKITMIEEALKSFAIQNNRLPCPANSAVSYNASTAGDEYCTGNKTVTPAAPSNYTNAGAAANTVILGSVPTKALGLPKDFMLDEWGKKISYAVSNPITTGNIKDANMGLIRISNDTAGNVITSNAAYILISHGKDGHGAYKKDGTQADEPTDLNEIENGHNSSAFNASFIYKEQQTSNFDDIVRYKQKFQLFDSGIILSGATCALNKTLQETINTEIGYCLSSSTDSNCKNYLNLLLSEMTKKCPKAYHLN